MAKPKVIVIVGPTASGKTSLSIDIAKRFNGEVISADSRQVYKGLNIGTAKVTPEEMDGVPHHLIDVVEPTEVYTAADFKREAAAVIDSVNHRGRVPIIAGGTFFYVDTLLGRISLPEVPPNERLRSELETLSVTELTQRLATLDPIRMETIDKENPRRLIRAIEVATALGNVPPPTTTESTYDALLLGINVDKDSLRQRFAARAKAWLAGGFLEEVRTLLAAGISRERLAEIGFEYQLGLELIDGTIDVTTFEQRFVEKNWQYAKRQLTWLKRDQSIVWVEPENRSAIFRLVDDFLTN